MRFHLRLLLETLFLTALIWTYADQASYETFDGVVAVKIVTPTPDMVARIEGARPGATGTADTIYIPMKLRGPKAAVRKLEMEKGTGTTPFPPLSIRIADDVEPQVTHIRDIREDVAQMPAIRDNGLQLEELSPQAILFVVDRYVPIKLSLDTDPGRFSEALAGKPQIEPNTVTVKVLESELKQKGPFEPRLVIPIEAQIRRRDQDAAAVFEVPLGSTWEGMDAKFEPEQVRVSVLLTRSYERVNITVIPLRVLMPPGAVAGDYEIEWQTPADQLQDIDVRMPIGKSRALSNTDVRAFIELEKTDLPGETLPAATAPASTEGWIQREIHFWFPPEFEGVQVDGPARQVKFRIKKKGTSADLPQLSELSR